MYVNPPERNQCAIFPFQERELLRWKPKLFYCTHVKFFEEIMAKSQTKPFDCIILFRLIFFMIHVRKRSEEARVSTLSYQAQLPPIFNSMAPLPDTWAAAQQEAQT